MLPETAKSRPSTHARRRVGACSWSLRAGGPRDLARAIRQVGVDAVQLHLDPLRTGDWSEAGTLDAFEEAGIELRSGMMGMAGEDYSSLDSIRRTGGVRPDATWPANRRAAEANARLAQRLKLPLVSFHAGFLPHARGDAERATLIERLRQMIDLFAARGVRVALETGQESAETLLGVLAELDRPAAAVNFDPANMILYGMGDPIQALRELAPRVAQVHIKDAQAATHPGTWGEELRVGTGQVDWPAFFAVLDERAAGVDCMIEREAGEARIDDMRAARELVERFR